MGYKKTYNRYSIWKNYCESNLAFIEKLNVNKWVFDSEKNFRDFATNGYKDDDKNILDFDSLDDNIFWELFRFTNDFFEFDMILFKNFEASRLKR